MNKHEFFNELIVLFSGYTLFFFTEYSDFEPELRYNVGWGSICCLLVLLLFNIMAMLREIGSKSKHSFKKKVFQIKVKEA